jgi:hypothetical protein
VVTPLAELLNSTQNRQTMPKVVIVTDDEALARELRSLRHWGDRTIEFGPVG